MSTIDTAILINLYLFIEIAQSLNVTADVKSECQECGVMFSLNA